MVKGRRVRAVVAYARSDDCCSPNPKRKDQRINVNPLITAGPKQSIARFFQAVSVDVEYSNPADTPSVIDVELANIEDLSCKDVDKFDLDRTAEAEELRKDGFSPPTPHRIELHSEINMGPPKPARCSRIINNQQQAANPLFKTAPSNNHKLTEYFPVRRSARKTKKTVLEEKQRSLEQAVRSAAEDGLEVRCFEGKGRGVIATKSFCKGDYVVEYSGELVDLNEAKQREQKYSEDQNTGCYMYYFKHKNQQYCIDATAETGRLGRLVNHSRNGNLLTRTVSVDGKPRLVLIAKDVIEAGEEITYDYGDRSKESLKHHPWLAL